MEKLNRAQKCSILGPQNLGSRGAPPGSAPDLLKYAHLSVRDLVPCARGKIQFCTQTLSYRHPRRIKKALQLNIRGIFLNYEQKAFSFDVIKKINLD